MKFLRFVLTIIALLFLTRFAAVLLLFLTTEGEEERFIMAWAGPLLISAACFAVSRLLKRRKKDEKNGFLGE